MTDIMKNDFFQNDLFLFFFIILSNLSNKLGGMKWSLNEKKRCFYPFEFRYLWKISIKSLEMNYF